MQFWGKDARTGLGHDNYHVALLSLKINKLSKFNSTLPKFYCQASYCTLKRGVAMKVGVVNAKFTSHECSFFSLGDKWLLLIAILPPKNCKVLMQNVSCNRVQEVVVCCWMGLSIDYLSDMKGSNSH